MRIQSARVDLRSQALPAPGPQQESEVQDAIDYLIDAKYKGRGDGSRLTIADSDVYEALAFMEAAKVNLVFLIYPSSRTLNGLGTIDTFTQVTIGSRRIVGVTVQMEGVSRPFGLRHFSLHFAQEIARAAAILTSPV